MNARTIKTQSRKLLACFAAALLLTLPVGSNAFAAATDEAQVTQPGGAVITYSSLKTAIEQAPDGSTVTLLKDATLSPDGDAVYSLNIAKPLTLDGGGHTLTVHHNGIYLVGSDDESAPSAIAMRNLSIVNPDSMGRVVSARDGYKTLAFDDVDMSTTGSGNTQVFTVGGNTPKPTDIAFAGCTLQASEAGYGIITFNPVNMTIADTDVSGYGALYLKGQDYSAGSDGSVVNVVGGSKLIGKGIAGPTNVFGTIVMQGCKDVKVNVTDSTVTAEADDAEPPTPQAVVMFSHSTDSAGTIAENDTVTFDGSSTVTATGSNGILAQGNGNTNTLTAKAGSFQIDGSLFYPDAGAEGTELVVTGGHWNKDVSDYVPKGYAQTREADGSFTVDPNQDKDANTTDGNTTGADGNMATHDGNVIGGNTTQQATPNGNVGNVAPKATGVNGTQNSSIQQTGDTPWALIAGMAAAAMAAGGLVLLKRRMEA